MSKSNARKFEKESFVVLSMLTLKHISLIYISTYVTLNFMSHHKTY